jgi:hypothetical protein
MLKLAGLRRTRRWPQSRGFSAAVFLIGPGSLGNGLLLRGLQTGLLKLLLLNLLR